MSVAVLCTVRGCARALVREGRRWHCARGHSFDVARSGYVSLLQPQDRRSAAPGDRREAVAARRRVVEAGLADALLSAILRAAHTAPRSAVLDAGCGEGTILARTAGAGTEGWGVDLSIAALDLAARRHRGCAFVAANADRGLPFADGSFGLVLSVAGRRNPAEFRRVLGPEGLALVAVPGEGDLAELRAAVLGRADPLDRLAKVRAEFREGFAEEGADEVSERRLLEPAVLRDLLASTYRGQRARERANVAALRTMEVRLHWKLARLRRRG